MDVCSEDNPCPFIMDVDLTRTCSVCLLISYIEVSCTLIQSATLSLHNAMQGTTKMGWPCGKNARSSSTNLAALW
jgi:hypothetical protein